MQHNVGRRPIVWSVTAGSGFAGLADYVVQRGLGFQLQTAPPDTTDPDLDLRRLAGAPLDVPDTERAGLRDLPLRRACSSAVRPELEPTSASAAASLALPLIQLVYAHQATGDRERTERAHADGRQVSPNPGLRRPSQDLLAAPAPRPTADPREAGRTYTLSGLSA